MNACDAVQELLVAHLLAALGPSEEALVRDHLAGCAPCRGAREDAHGDLARVDAPPVAPPAEVWKRLRQRIAQREAEDPVRDHTPDLVIALACSFCRGGLTRLSAVYCAACLAPHHPECFVDHGRCSVMGCGETRVVRPNEVGSARELPAARPRRRRLGRGLGGLIGVAAAAAAGTLAAAALRDGDWLRAPGAAATPERAGGPGQTAAPDAPRPLGADASGSAQLGPQAAGPGVAEDAEDLRRVWLDARDASLGELIAALRAESDLPVDATSAAGALLVGSVRWDGEPWRLALANLAARLGLELQRSDGGALLFVVPPGELAAPRAEATTLERRLFRVLPGAAQSAALLATAAGGRMVAAEATDVVALASSGPGGAAVWIFSEGALVAERWVDGPVAEVSLAPDGRRMVLARDEERAAAFCVWDPRSPQAPLRWASLAPLEVRAALGFRWAPDGSALLIGAGSRWARVEPERQSVAPVSLGRCSDVHLVAPHLALALAPGEVVLWDLAEGEPVSRWELPGAATRGEATLALARAAGVVVVGTPAGTHLLELRRRALRERPRIGWPTLGGGAPQLSADGRSLAWRVGALAYAGPLTDLDGGKAALAPADGQAVQGLAWSPAGARLALWTDNLAYVAPASGDEAPSLSSAGGPLFSAAAGERIVECTWGGEALAIVTEAPAPRAASVSARVGRRLGRHQRTLDGPAAAGTR